MIDMNTSASVVEQLGNWASTMTWNDLSPAAQSALKGRVLDAVGCAVGGLSAGPIKSIRQLSGELGGEPLATCIGGGKTAPDRAAFVNGSAIRYLDFNDSYLAKGETCHPSDNIAPVLAAAEYARTSGREFLVALAIAYQVQCRLSDVAPVRRHGFDHTVQGAYGAAAGAARAMGLPALQIANAVAISGTSYNSLRVTRTGELSNWKGLAFPNTAMGAVHAALLAKYGISGPREVFEGNKGFMDAIVGKFDINWTKEDLEKVTQTITKRYNAEIHSQSAIEGLLELRDNVGLKAEDIEWIRLAIFDVAFDIIGGGEEGDKRSVHTKEEADHSLPYLLAVACLDGQVMPEQYLSKRIVSEDVQKLLRKVNVYPAKTYTDQFPQFMSCKIDVETKDGQRFQLEKRDYQGFRTRPATWRLLLNKYMSLTQGVDDALRTKIADVIFHLDEVQVTELTDLLGQIRVSDGKYLRS